MKENNQKLELGVLNWKGNILIPTLKEIQAFILSGSKKEDKDNIKHWTSQIIFNYIQYLIGANQVKSDKVFDIYWNIKEELTKEFSFLPKYLHDFSIVSELFVSVAKNFKFLLYSERIAHNLREQQIEPTIEELFLDFETLKTLKQKFWESHERNSDATLEEKDIENFQHILNATIESLIMDVFLPDQVQNNVVEVIANVKKAYIDWKKELLANYKVDNKKLNEFLTHVVFTIVQKREGFEKQKLQKYQHDQVKATKGIIN